MLIQPNLPEPELLSMFESTVAFLMMLMTVRQKVINVSLYAQLCSIL